MDNLKRMGDLIDRDRLLDFLYEWKGRLGNSPQEEAIDLMIKVMVDKVKAQPVAYDLGGVLEEMEELREFASVDTCLECGMCSRSGANTCQEHYMLNAIDVVKAGVKA